MRAALALLVVVLVTSCDDAAPAPLLLSTAGTVSVVVMTRSIVITPWCVPALIASNASFSVA